MSRVRGKLVNMIKDVGGKIDDYKLGGYKLAEKDFFLLDLTN